MRIEFVCINAVHILFSTDEAYCNYMNSFYLFLRSWLEFVYHCFHSFYCFFLKICSISFSQCGIKIGTDLLLCSNIQGHSKLYRCSFRTTVLASRISGYVYFICTRQIWTEYILPVGGLTYFAAWKKCLFHHGFPLLDINYYIVHLIKCDLLMLVLEFLAPMKIFIF